MTPRKLNDAYYTPEVDWVVHQLMERVRISGNVIEPCAGDGRMGKVIKRNGLACYESDITTGECALEHDYTAFDWCVTNPPYNMAYEILKRAREGCRKGVAFHLRLSFMEPLKVDPRGEWLAEYPPTQLIVLPRMSFDGKGTDSVTSAWMIWERGKTGTISVAHRGQLSFATHVQKPDREGEG